MPAKLYIIPTDTSYGIGCRLEDRESYNLLYTMKGRDTDKHLAILLPTWDDLTYETTLSLAQINFLKTYKFPFTIVCDVKEDFRDEYPLLDDKQYETIGFRVAEACLPAEAKPYIRSPLFLTSANKSGETECQNLEEIHTVFSEYVDFFREIP